MLTESNRPSSPASLPRNWRRAFWLAVYVAMILIPLLTVLLTRPPSGKGLGWDIAVGFGFAALLMMATQFLLTARFRRATTPFGIDLIYYFHRYVAYVIVILVLLHLSILLARNPGLIGLLDPVSGSWPVIAGAVSATLLLAVAAISAFRKKLRVPYEIWRISHLGLAVGAVAFGFIHLMEIGSRPAALSALWAVIGFSLVAVVIRVRVIRPWQLTRTPWKVEEVAAERGDCWTLTLIPDGHPGIDFQPGQFAWVTLRGSPFAMREHPFSIASAPEPNGRLRFTIKGLGDFTRNLGRIQPEEMAYVDGPYGVFSIDCHPEAAGYVFIAGGIGISPMVGMLRALADRGDERSHLLVAAHASWDRVPLRDEIARLRKRLRLRVVHVLEESPETWDGERGWVTRDLLDRSLPETDRESCEYFVCGPLVMTRAVEGFLRELEVPVERVHVELFDMV